MSHRLEFLGKLPPHSDYLGVAVSGGPDSMAILDFLIRGGRKVIAFHFNHGTDHGIIAERFIRQYCLESSIPYAIGYMDRYLVKPKSKSPEEHWRDERYRFLEAQDHQIITAHTLDDQVENWIFTSLHGNPRLIPYRRNNIIRPFLLTRKDAMINWCERKEVPYLTDPSNSSSRYMRSYIRTEIVPKALHVNPGLHKVVKKKVKKMFEFSETS
jgi:tRNA(Ile)-lysidine synthase